jgi:long-chain acyl-CoA synthetase
MSQKNRLFDPSATIVDDKKSIFFVKDILTSANEVFSGISPNTLALFLCRNTLNCVSLYINCIARKVVPILIDAEADVELVNTLIRKYRPDIIFLPADKEYNTCEYSLNLSYFEYSIFRRIDKSFLELYSNLSLLLSTSGTTGSPKLVRLSYENLLGNASAISQYLKLDKSERAITSLPLNYSFGLSIINSHLYCGASVVVTNESITQRNFWTIFSDFQVTSLSGVPYTFELLKKFRLLDQNLPSLRTLTQAGGKLSEDLAKHFSNLSSRKGLNFYMMYGQTEGTARLSYLDPQYNFLKTGSIGKPIPGGRFQICDENGNLITEPGTPGELIYFGSNVMLGYAESHNDLKLGDINNGKLSTGDIAMFDNEGFYYIVGRKKRFIKLFGNRVNLDELETLLFNNGIISACTGSDNKLIVCLTEECLLDKTKFFLSHRLGIHISAIRIYVVDSIPKSAAGKILYSKLPIE